MIQCQDSAFREFFKEMKRRGHLKTFPIDEYNHGRHRLIQIDRKRYYVVYKRDWFNTFGKQFNLKEYSGVGESINKEYLELALNRNAEKIVFIHPDGMFGIYPALIKNFCEKNDLVRTQDKPNHYKGLNGFTETIRETTYSFPKELLEGF